MKGTGRHWWVVGACFLLSVGGVVYAVKCSHVAADGGRGGALAVALTFLMLFMDRGTAKDSLKGDDEKPIEPEDVVQGKDLARSHNAIAAFLDWQAKQNLPLALSSVMGTLFWGFGDVVAGCFGVR